MERRFSHSQASLGGISLILAVESGKSLPVTGPPFGQLAKLVALYGEAVGAIVSDGILRKPFCWKTMEIWHFE